MYTFPKRILIFAFSLLFLATVTGCGIAEKNVSLAEWKGFATATAAPVSTLASVQANDASFVVDSQGVDLDALTDEEIDRLLDVAEALTIRVYEQVSPSVVHITSRVIQMGFFGTYPSEGTGSGFVLDKQGHIVTNYHVIEGAQSVDVTLLDATTVEAEIIGVDPFSDLAVLRVDVPADKLFPVEIDYSLDLRVGQRAIAIGNPFGLDWTLTAGVISSLGRPLQISDDRVIFDVIQTDAAINPGNSGGPLLNSRGQLIGVNSAIRQDAENIGFAIPVSTLKRVLPELLNKGRYSHPTLGVTGYDLFPELAQRLDLPVESGILIVRVDAGSAGAKAGIVGAQRQVYLGNSRVYIGGDILVALNGKPIDGHSSLLRILETETVVGQQVEVTLYRGDRLIKQQVTLSD